MFQLLFISSIIYYIKLCCPIIELYNLTLKKYYILKYYEKNIDIMLKLLKIYLIIN